LPERRGHGPAAFGHPDRPATRAGLAAATLLAILGAGCGHADPQVEPSAEPAAVETQVEPEADAASGSGFEAASALCRAAEKGSIRARLQGVIDTEIDWAAPGVRQCLGGPRPGGDGVRLVYKGQADNEPLLLIIGIALARSAPSGRNVPASVTIVREGAGEFYATQGDDKCALDAVRQEPVAGAKGLYFLTGRGYCTQPARAVPGGTGAVLVSRFDVEAVIAYPQEQ
jgi:hypothetical protein